MGLVIPRGSRRQRRVGFPKLRLESSWIAFLGQPSFLPIFLDCLDVIVDCNLSKITTRIRDSINSLISPIPIYQKGKTKCFIPPNDHIPYSIHKSNSHEKAPRPTALLSSTTDNLVHCSRHKKRARYNVLYRYITGNCRSVLNGSCLQCR